MTIPPARINEMAVELHALLSQQKTVSSFEKVQTLSWLKVGEVKTVEALAIDGPKFFVFVSRIDQTIFSSQY